MTHFSKVMHFVRPMYSCTQTQKLQNKENCFVAAAVICFVFLIIHDPLVIPCHTRTKTEKSGSTNCQL